MANNSDQVCSSFWNGKVTEDDLYTSLAKMSKQDFDAYMGMIKAAIKLEIASTEPINQNPAKFQVGFKAIQEKESIEDSTKVTALMEKGFNISGEGGCYMAKKVMAVVSKIDKVSAEGLLRYWSTI